MKYSRKVYKGILCTNLAIELINFLHYIHGELKNTMNNEANAYQISKRTFICFDYQVYLMP